VTAARSEHHVGEDRAFRLAKPGYGYVFPRDHGSHDEFRTEWWYYTGHLHAKSGRRFGFQLTFFRRAVNADRLETLPSRWTIRQLYLAHFAIADLNPRQFHHTEKVSREGLNKAGAEKNRLHVWIDQWSAEAIENEPLRQRLRASAPDFAVDLTVQSLKAPVIHGRDGISRKGSDSGQASHYYSLTRMATAGHVSIDGEMYEVEGTSWMDHEFGSADLGADLVGWDWFSLQLSDGSEVMIYQLRRANGSFDGVSSGTMVDRDGRGEFFPLTDLHIAVRAYWTSPKTGARYPAAWTISIPSRAVALEISPLMADQELSTKRSTQVTYWEGAVQASGTVRDHAVSGQGYVELTGYAERFDKRL
jgi:predicted secreted hydrolase